MESEDRKGFDPQYISEPYAVPSPELQRAWQSLEERYKVGDILTTKVVDIHNIGLIVEVDGSAYAFSSSLAPTALEGVVLLRFLRAAPAKNATTLR